MERDSPHIDAAVWPWSLAGWLLAAISVLIFGLAWLRFEGVDMLALGMVVLAMATFAVIVGFVVLCERI